MTPLAKLRSIQQTAFDRVEYFAKDGRDMNANETYTQRRYWKDALTALAELEQALREDVLRMLDIGYRGERFGTREYNPFSVENAHRKLAKILNDSPTAAGTAGKEKASPE